MLVDSERLFYKILFVLISIFFITGGGLAFLIQVAYCICHFQQAYRSIMLIFAGFFELVKMVCLIFIILVNLKISRQKKFISSIKDFGCTEDIFHEYITSTYLKVAQGVQDYNLLALVLSAAMVFFGIVFYINLFKERRYLEVIPERNSLQMNGQKPDEEEVQPSIDKSDAKLNGNNFDKPSKIVELELATPDFRNGLKFRQSSKKNNSPEPQDLHPKEE